MKTGVTALLAALTLSGTASANDLPHRLQCKVSGHAGCSAQKACVGSETPQATGCLDTGPKGPGITHVCVGAGTRDPTIRMTIDTQARTISINDLQGHIEGDIPIDAAKTSFIRWRWGLIALDEIRANYTNSRDLYVTLSDPTTELEFLCSG